MKTLATSLFLYAAAIKLAPVTGLLFPLQIPSAYGVSFDDPNLMILLRHRAALFGVVGVLLATAALRPRLRPLATAAGLFSMLSFIAIVWLDGPANEELTRVAAIDATAAIALVAAYALDRRQKTTATDA